MSLVRNVIPGIHLEICFWKFIHTYKKMLFYLTILTVLNIFILSIADCCNVYSQELEIIYKQRLDPKDL